MKQITPLELVFRVAELGGWSRVELLTAVDNPPECDEPDVDWMAVLPPQIEFYSNPQSELWHVFDVRVMSPERRRKAAKLLSDYYNDKEVAAYMDHGTIIG